MADGARRRGKAAICGSSQTQTILGTAITLQTNTTVLSHHMSLAAVHCRPWSRTRASSCSKYAGEPPHGGGGSAPKAAPGRAADL